MNASDLMVSVRVPFRYGVSSGVLAGSAVATVPLTLDAQTSFELHQIVGTSSADVETNSKDNNYTVLIAQINGQQWSSLPVPQECICIQAIDGWRFKLPVILPPRFQMTFAFVDLGAGGTHLVELVGFMLKG
jgi:hypothetical protein